MRFYSNFILLLSFPILCHSLHSTMDVISSSSSNLKSIIDSAKASLQSPLESPIPNMVFEPQSSSYGQGTTIWISIELFWIAKPHPTQHDNSSTIQRRWHIKSNFHHMVEENQLALSWILARSTILEPATTHGTKQSLPKSFNGTDGQKTTHVLTRSKQILEMSVLLVQYQVGIPYSNVIDSISSCPINHSHRSVMDPINKLTT